MQFRSILITGGAGFVGSNLGVWLRAAYPGISIAAIDNLQRRGATFNLPRLAANDIRFVQGDVCEAAAVEQCGAFDLIIACAAEPAVSAGASGSPLPTLQSNLIGLIPCLEAARRRGAACLFLSSSRVYPIDRLRGLHYTESATRLAWANNPATPGFSSAGIAEDFPLAGARSFYGAAKLAAELLLAEYARFHGMPVLINRCGLLAGPWQMPRADQGVISFWVHRHLFGQPLKYIGFGGAGKQVRDALHIDDLAELIDKQLNAPGAWTTDPYNVGGGRDRAISLLELTVLCQRVTGKIVPIASDPATSPVDIPLFITDFRRAEGAFGWTPTRSIERIARDVAAWAGQHESTLRSHEQ